MVNLYQKEYSFPFGPPPMNPSEQQFLDALAQLGGSAGHGALRQKLGWNQPTYDQIQTTQKDQGKILPGRGRGGSLRLAKATEADQQTPDLFGVSGADPAGKSRPVSPATPKESGRQPKAAPSTSSATIGKTVDDAMVAIERDNPRLKGVLPKDYARPCLDKQRLGELIDVIVA